MVFDEFKIIIVISNMFVENNYIFMYIIRQATLNTWNNLLNHWFIMTFSDFS